MKKPITLMLVLLSAIFFVFAQDKTLQNQPETITITFKNNSMLLRKYTFVTYAPGSDRNGTYGDFMWPGGIKEFTVVVGTRFYLVDSQQKDLVMSGNKLSGTPFHTVKAEDNGKTINLRKS